MNDQYPDNSLAATEAGRTSGGQLLSPSTDPKSSAPPPPKFKPSDRFHNWLCHSRRHDELVYPAGCLVVLWSRWSNEQRYYANHTANVSALALASLDTDLAASAQVSEPTAPAQVHLWSLTSLDTLQVLDDNHFGQRRIFSLKLHNTQNARGRGAKAPDETVDEIGQHSQSAQQPPYHLYGIKAFNIAFSAVHQRYSNFIGAPHFRAIAQLLGYEGVAVVIDNLLKVVKSLIQGTISGYCRTLQGVMPKLCKLPLYDYGSTGVLEYYQAQLKDVIQFPDVKTAMFQSFREMGNAILFCMLIEQSLSKEEVCDLLQAAPFQNLLPVPFCKDGERPESKIKRLEQKYASLQVLKNIEQLGSDEQASLANEGDLLTTERLCCGLSIFDAVLNKIKAFLLNNREQATVWIGPANNPPVVIYDDECIEFHRIWSALQFIYCIPIGQGEFTVEQLFGEGHNWAGCVMITLLGQQKRFEALDFSYHLLKVQRVDGKDEIVRGVPLKRMVDMIRRFQVLNSQIFSIINKYINSNSPEETKLEQVKVFSSP